MKAQLLMLLTVGSLLAGRSAQAATDRELQSFLNRAQAQAQSSIEARGVDLGGRPVTVSGFVQADGRLTAVRLVSSTGSSAGDAAVQEAIRAVRLKDVPPLMSTARLTFVLHPGAIVQARTP